MVMLGRARPSYSALKGTVATLCFTGLVIGAATPALGQSRNGSAVFNDHCATCHGSDGRAQNSKGKFSHARDFTDAKWQDEATDERIFNSITNGRSVRGNMPAFSNKMNQQEVESLVNFVRSFKGESKG